jgi:hypothetical protein
MRVSQFLVTSLSSLVPPHSERLLGYLFGGVVMHDTKIEPTHKVIEMGAADLRGLRQIPLFVSLPQPRVLLFAIHAL